MSYLALYRKYRPSGFDGVVGQDHIVKTLVHQIETGRVGHAYLFCGSRGTGKTSTARIFARAINCLEPINGSPCGKCAACKGLDNYSNLDIIEIDAASNNRVDEIRDLRDKVTFPPTVGKYKVYIIDEVHMLTDQAFNALLKTLEEPPSFAVFILATTESYKVPATILSRCMRFDFRLISEVEIFNEIKRIYDDLGKSYDEEALHLIAKAGNGSMRDALSVADVCLSYSDKKLTYNDALCALGASDKTELYSLCKSILDGSSGKALEIVDKLISKGKSVGVIAADLVALFRDLFVTAACDEPLKLLCVPKTVFDKYLELSKDVTEARLNRIIQLFSSIEGELKYTAHPRITLESAVIKAAMPETDWDLQALLSRITTLERAVKNGEFTVKQIVTLSAPTTEKIEEKEIAVNTAKPVNSVNEKSVEVKKTEIKAEIKQQPQLVEEKPYKPVTAEEFYEGSVKTKNLSDSKPMEILGLLNRRLRQNKEIMLWALFQNLKVVIEDNTLVVLASSAGDKAVIEKSENVKTLKKLLAEYGDIEITVRISSKEADKKEVDEGIDEIKRIFGDIVKTD